MQNIEKMVQEFADGLKRLGDKMSKVGEEAEAKFAREYAAEQSPIDDLSSDYESATHGE
jgi:hypothetical protein